MSLPLRPTLEWLRKTAKERLQVQRQSQPTARLTDSLRSLARDYGFASWSELKEQVEAAARQPGKPTRDEIVGPFLRRVRTGQIDDVRALLTAAPKLVNATGPHPFWGGRPQPLHMAIEGKHRDMFDLLLEKGADIDGANAHYSHWSPLMLAINDAPDLRDELIRRGATVGLPEALLLGDDARVETLLASGRLPDITPSDGSLLAFARTPAAIDRLLTAGAATDAKDRWGATPIEALSRLGTRGAPLVRHLVTRGVTAAPQEYARIGDIDTLRGLADRDPAVVRLDAVMMAAVDFAHHHMVEWLLGQSASANARAEAQSQQTALHSAAWNGDLPMVQRLVAAGADRDARDKEHDGTPCDWAGTSIEVTGNQKCAAVVAYFEGLSRAAG